VRCLSNEPLPFEVVAGSIERGVNKRADQQCHKSERRAHHVPKKVATDGVCAESHSNINLHPEASVHAASSCLALRQPELDQAADGLGP
jgi:hypothetical protein